MMRYPGLVAINCSLAGNIDTEAPRRGSSFSRCSSLSSCGGSLKISSTSNSNALKTETRSMEVDSSSEEATAPPTDVVVPQAKLKRSSSAPLLIASSGTLWSPQGSSSRPSSPVPHQSFQTAQTFREGLRSRTLSTSGPHSPVVPRVHQIRAEEMEGVAIREAQQERELASKLAISQSWDDLSIDETPSPSSPAGARRLHSPIFTCPSPSHQAPSPKQCYSPSIKQAMRAPSSPSPTRVQRHRSQSPHLVLRPSSLGPVKRKLSSDSDQEVDRAKRLLTLEEKLIHVSSEGHR